MEVQSIALNSANVRYNNANDEARVFDIEANVNIQGGNVNGFEGGIVKENGLQVATFTMWGTNLNPSFQGMEASKMCEVLMAINEFIASVKENVLTNEIDV